MLVNGGGRKAQNYQSHLLHLRSLYDLLRAADVAPDLITLYVSDGADPAGDVALREVQPETDFWLLEGSRLEAPLRTPVAFVDSQVPGAPLAPATRATLQQWFDTTGRTLRAGDTLLLYVTDHGTKGDRDDPLDNAITLWGENERLSVSELATMLGGLDPGVRVVTLMSQCYSGGFAELARARSSDPLPDGSTCGYFSSTADRPAYGCYPENRGRDNVGHSFHFIEALAERGDFRAAHDEVLVRDATPDVPLRTSDMFLAEVIDAAAAAEQDPTRFTDGLLALAWRAPEAWESELRLLDRMARAYGFAGPRTLGGLDDQAGDLPDLATQLRNRHTAWQAALDSAVRANLARFETARPDWTARLDDKSLRALDPASARTLTAELLRDLAAATRADPSTADRLALLRERATESGSVAYRMDVRAGALLRLRALLKTVAGRVYLAQHGTPEQQAAYQALVACEEAISLPPVPVPEELRLARSEPFPPLDDDLAAANRATPAWMGIQFKQAAETVRAEADLAAGTARVVAVYGDSPAKLAGLRAGDLVLGPPGRHFAEPDQIREWTMLLPVEVPARLDVERDGKRIAVTLVPKPFPQRWPKLPGPPKVGAIAPPLHVRGYRGQVPPSLATGRPHLLFFWATWCAACKAALPEVVDFARQRHVEVIAVTDEDPTRLDAFFAIHAGPFPAIVATDQDRRSFVDYGVGGVPTFVLVDGEGRVAAHATGYSAATGLPIEGWRWSARPGPPQT